MTPARWKQIKEIFASALQYDPSRRTEFLAKACGSDQLLHEEVQSLIESHEKSGSFIGSRAYAAAATMLMDKSLLLTEGQVLGSYRILSILGRGGMGDVFLAEDTRLGRRVALKFLPPEFALDRERLLRFKQEARTTSALNHPNILTIYEIGELEGHNFIAGEYVEGETLRQRLVHSRLTLNESVEIASQIAAALAAADQAGIVHRDIKPENVMLRPDGLVKVLDFGLAKLTVEPQSTPDQSTRAMFKTNAGMVLGTIAYMSPEQARGLPVDGRTDVWSLGVVLYEMVAGCAPFSGATTSDLLASILEHEPPPLVNNAMEVPETLEWIVVKALTKDQDDRYQTAREMLTDLRRLKHRLSLSAELERRLPERSNPDGNEANARGVDRKRWRRLLVSLTAAVVVLGALLLWVGLPHLKSAKPVGPPIVTLMDSPLPDRVYDPETRKSGGTNADDITDILRELPISIEKENTSALWHREDQVLRQNPALIVIHRSAFSDSSMGFDPNSAAAAAAESKVEAFIGYASLGNPKTKFLVYTRRSENMNTWAQDLERRFPQLQGRISTLVVPGGTEHASFRDPVTAKMLRQQVQSLLGLNQ